MPDGANSPTGAGCRWAGGRLRLAPGPTADR